jgi:DNA-directed RNA polymerase subunit RPC12/RpoP
VSDENIGSVSLPLDSDDFLRRECPHCGREFKWYEGDSETETEMEAGGYHCPYCDGRSEDGWWTKAQLEVVGQVAGHYAESGFHDMFKRLERQSSEFVKFEAGPAPRQPQTTLSESDDMRRVDFECHRNAPLKVLDEWAERVHCLVCGSLQ